MDFTHITTIVLCMLAIMMYVRGEIIVEDCSIVIEIGIMEAIYWLLCKGKVVNMGSPERFHVDLYFLWKMHFLILIIFAGHVSYLLDS